MERYHTVTASRQPQANSFISNPERKRLFLAARLRTLQAQLRQGLDIRRSELTLLMPYCIDSGGTAARS